MRKKEFIVAALNPEHETFVVYIASLSSTLLVVSFSSTLFNTDIQLFCRPQISSLIVKKTSIKVSNKYVDFADIFSPNLVSKLSEHTGIINHAIKLANSHQPPYRSIYSLDPVELETLKAYIETNLANAFITPTNSPANTPILFNQKLDGSF